MNASEFVDVVRQSVCDAAVRATISNLERPPGRQPPEDLVRRSNWYRALDEMPREIVKDIVRSSVESAVFGFLSLLDGVRPFEKTAEKGSFELRFLKGDVEEIISPCDSYYLHELFR
jgi:hypothetical protein